MIRRRTCFVLGATLPLLGMLAALGPPRLIGTGCAHAPLAGVAFAREESDFIGPCRMVRRLPWITE